MTMPTTNAKHDKLNWARSRNLVKRLEEPSDDFPLRMRTGWNELTYNAGYNPENIALTAGTNIRNSQNPQSSLKSGERSIPVSSINVGFSRLTNVRPNVDANRQRMMFSVKNCQIN